MSHPFFDASEFPWERKDASALHACLYRAVTDPEKIDLLCKKCGGNVQLTKSQTPEVIWKQVLEQLTAGVKLRKLCDLLLEDETLAAIHPAVEAVTQATVVRDATMNRHLAKDLADIATKSIAELLTPQAETEFIRQLAQEVESVSGQTWAACPTNRELAEAMVQKCDIDQMLPRLLVLAGRFRTHILLISDLTAILLPCNYDPEQVSRLRNSWSERELCFFYAPNETLAEAIMAAFDGKPMVMADDGVRGASAVDLEHAPPTAGPDALFSDAFNILRDLILERTFADLEGSRLGAKMTTKIDADAVRIQAHLLARNLFNQERTTYCLAKMPTDPNEERLRRLVLGKIFSSVNADQAAPILAFGELVQSSDAHLRLQKPTEHVIRVILSLPKTL